MQLIKNFPYGGKRVAEHSQKKSSSNDSNLKKIRITPDESANARLVNRKSEHEPDVIKEVVQEIMDNLESSF